MQSTSSILTTLRKDFPGLQFFSGDQFYWSSQERTVYYNVQEAEPLPLLLHELAHALLEHKNYKRDIDLIKLEREAWDYTSSTLGPRYNVLIPVELVETTLDTYRDWLLARSTCPSCSATGYQVGQLNYLCPACQQSWRVNEARSCALRRYTIN